MSDVIVDRRVGLQIGKRLVSGVDEDLEERRVVLVAHREPSEISQCLLAGVIEARLGHVVVEG